MSAPISVVTSSTWATDGPGGKEFSNAKLPRAEATLCECTKSTHVDLYEKGHLRPEHVCNSEGHPSPIQSQSASSGLDKYGKSPLDFSSAKLAPLYLLQCIWRVGTLNLQNEAH